MSTEKFKIHDVSFVSITESERLRMIGCEYVWWSIISNVL